MKKVWKIILISLLILFLAIGGTVYYFLNVKTYETADEEVEEITESEYDIVLPEIDSSTSNPVNTSKDGIDNSSEDTTNTDDDSHTESNNTSSNVDTSKDNNSDKGSNVNTDDSSNAQPQSGSENQNEITVAMIKERYRPVFESLESQANAKIDGLVNRAYGEYQQKKSNDESISIAYFYKKYTSAGRELENKTDETFNYIYSALQDSLKKHGYSPNHAQEFKDQYESAKSARESALLNKAKEAL